jgi:hypothetical protein
LSLKVTVTVSLLELLEGLNVTGDRYGCSGV